MNSAHLTVSPRPVTVRCGAAAGSTTSCVGPRAVVRIVDRDGNEATGCVEHAADLYATWIGARLFPSPGHAEAVFEVYARAQMLTTQPNPAALPQAA
ncbi:hypothetical protein [Streptomyces albus]|uniref:hypothetical protein n=1 Tax=Streptomyces albus TaxID=1888 RepID=UPI0006B653AE|nr:hypothetical protein [Streptomyces albus]GHJ22963.1 hypothetical protein TPA0909_45770 [Streptomyces albus]